MNNPKRPNAVVSRLLQEDGLTLSDSQISEPVLDVKARAEFKNHITHLSKELAQARQYNDLPKIAALQAEKEAVENELKKAVGLGGRNRKIGKPMHEKIRKAVTNRIRATVKKITRNHQPLGQHLANSIHTGMFCSYRPEKSVPWMF